MAKKTTAAPRRAKAKAEGLELPLNTPVAAPAPVRAPVIQVKRTASAAKPASQQTDAPTAVKKIAQKTAAKSTQQVPALKRAATQPQPPAQPAGKPSMSSSETTGKQDPIAKGQELIATLETCGAIAAKGAESLSKEVVSLASGSVQAQFALTEALMNAKTLPEALTAQGNFARASLGNMTEGFAKLTGMSMELTQIFMAPIQAQVGDTARSIWRRAA